MPIARVKQLAAFFSKRANLLENQCVICTQLQSTPICRECEQQFFHIQTPRCIQCALPLLGMRGKQQRCGACLQKTPAFDSTIVACNYRPPVDHLALSLKFAHQLPLADLFASQLRDAVLDHEQLELPNLLAPVPLGLKRLQERGFNQALEIARPLSSHLGVPLIPNLLERNRETAQQSSLQPNQRHKNMRNAFSPNISCYEVIQGKHIGIVDDVMTTGTTLHEVAKTLKRFGASKVSNFVFARTVPH